jgi:hypothetical protein
MELAYIYSIRRKIAYLSIEGTSKTCKDIMALNLFIDMESEKLTESKK